MKLVKPKKFLGQHFLKDLQVAQDIADTVDACPALPVLEVGPGMGVLTQYLLKKSVRSKSWNSTLNRWLICARISRSWATISSSRTS